jgi:hypothetical protein
MEPVEKPVLTHLLLEELYEASKIAKPTARGTTLRYSSAGSCERQISYMGLGAKQNTPMDRSGAWATGLGTIVHEALQEAISRVFPRAEFEVSSQNGEISGSCDALVPGEDLNPEWAGTWVLYELKTMGTYSFDKQVGWNRMRSTVGYGEGPALKAITQAGMNALGIEKERKIRIENVIMGSITFEALSKNKSRNMGVNEYNRQMAEFHVPRDVWEPLALSEIKRFGSVADALKRDIIGDVIALSDNGEKIMLNPESGKHWQCDYCAYRLTCMEDGPGILSVSDSVMEKQ